MTTVGVAEVPISQNFQKANRLFKMDWEKAESLNFQVKAWGTSWQKNHHAYSLLAYSIS
jgi:hypothetical protein